jgi:hypothetical protein
MIPRHLPDSNGAETMASGLGVSAAHALVRERYAEEDARTKARLDFIVKVLGRCRYCRGKLQDRQIEKTPGVCGRKPCQRRALEERGR